MHRNDFNNTLAHEGFQTLVTATREPFSSLDVYIHPFGAQALVLEDAFSITVACVERKYWPGRAFHLPALPPHSER